MNTIIKKLNRSELDNEIVEQAGEILKAGGLVAFPTETVYGLGANALDEEAAKKIYAAKGRPSDNPLIVHVAARADVNEIAVDIPDTFQVVAEKFWPGPLTLILNKADKVPLGTTGGLQTVAIRMPNDVIALEMIRAGGGFIAAPSANTSGRPSPTSAQHVEEDLGGKIDMILDGGPVDIGVESTILDMTVEPPMILRPGAVTQEMLEEVLGKVDVDATIFDKNSTQAPKAPGMKYRHYAPKADLIIVDGEAKEAVKAIKQIAYEQMRLGYKVGIIATNESVNEYTTGVIKNIGSRDNEKTIARNLYKVLREFDEEDVSYIYSEAFSSDGIGTAVMNRLGKAAGHHVISADYITRLQEYRKIVFVSKSDNCRAPIAAAMLKNKKLRQEYQILSRGMIVLFPEPLNPMAEEMLTRDGIAPENYETEAFTDDLFEEDTLILVMEECDQDKLLNDYPNSRNVYTLCQYLDEEGEIESPYGQPAESYEALYRRMKEYIDKLADKLNKEAKI